MLTSFVSKHSLLGSWDLRLNHEGFAGQIPSLPDAEDSVRTWIITVVSAQPGLDGRCLSSVLPMAERVGLREMYTELSSGP